MKKLIIIILTIAFVSCTKDETCEKELNIATENYIKALNNCNGSSTAINSVSQQYEIKKQSILNNCK